MRKGQKLLPSYMRYGIAVDHAFRDCADLVWLSSHGMDVSLQRRPLFPMSSLYSDGILDSGPPILIPEYFRTACVEAT